MDCSSTSVCLETSRPKLLRTLTGPTVLGGRIGHRPLQGLSRPQSEFIGFRGDEPGRTSLMSVGRRGLVKGASLLFFRRRWDGIYKKKKKERMATSRIMVVQFHMRFWKLRGGGGGAQEGEREGLVTMNVHMHHALAKKEVKDPGRQLLDFWDELATYIVKYGVRVLGGDFNMALFCVVPELRARGVAINLAAWYPWKHELSDAVSIDSEALFIIGPTYGARMVYEPSILGLQNPPPLHEWRPVEHVEKDERGQEISRTRIPLRTFNFQGQGYPITSYMPDNHARRELYATWSFRPACNYADSAVAEIGARVRTDKGMFPWGIKDTELGRLTYKWATMQISKQKLANTRLFDPDALKKHLFAGGAHMPLQIYLGESCESRRTAGSRADRSAKAAARGWTHERIAATVASRGHGVNPFHGVQPASSSTGSTRGGGGPASWPSSTWSNRGSGWSGWRVSGWGEGSGTSS